MPAGRTRRLGFGWDARAAAALGAAAIVAGLAAPALAQEADPEAGRQVWMLKANCKSCHGWGGHGVPDVPQEPQGANLRATALSPEQFAEVVRCGRPGTDMPYFLANSWSATGKACYGLTRAEVGDALPPRSMVTLPEREIAALVAFVFKQFVGKPLPTLEECQEFFGGATSRCNEYPRRGG